MWDIDYLPHSNYGKMLDFRSRQESSDQWVELIFKAWYTWKLKVAIVGGIFWSIMFHDSWSCELQGVDITFCFTLWRNRHLIISSIDILKWFGIFMCSNRWMNHYAAFLPFFSIDYNQPMTLLSFFIIYIVTIYVHQSLLKVSWGQQLTFGLNRVIALCADWKSCWGLFLGAERPSQINNIKESHVLRSFTVPY